MGVWDPDRQLPVSLGSPDLVVHPRLASPPVTVARPGAGFVTLAGWSLAAPSATVHCRCRGHHQVLSVMHTERGGTRCGGGGEDHLHVRVAAADAVWGLYELEVATGEPCSGLGDQAQSLDLG